MMEDIIKQPKWKEVQYSRSQIISAGQIIRNSDSTVEDNKHAIEIIDNWREAHAFPLHVIYMHLRRMAESNPRVIVAERLKRLESITSKLRREQSMSLWTMQDLGGCRVIVENISDVYRYAEMYDKSKTDMSRRRLMTILRIQNHLAIEVCMWFINIIAIDQKNITKICL